MLTYGNTFAILKTWLRGNQATINNSAARKQVTKMFKSTFQFFRIKITVKLEIVNKRKIKTRK
nr:MAG TPA: hypothetical protein [Caudoviricetes sp.]